jgi:hypothetical protein
VPETLRYPTCDLRRHPPRPPREKLAGILFMARTVDKLRAKIQGTMGIYRIAPGISGYLLEGLGLTEEQLTAIVSGAKDDAEIVTWLEANTARKKIGEVNEMLANRRLRDDAHRAEFAPRYGILNERPDLWNWFEIFEADDVWMFDPKNAGKPGAAEPVA